MCPNKSLRFYLHILYITLFFAAPTFENRLYKINTIKQYWNKIQISQYYRKIFFSEIANELNNIIREKAILSPNFYKF